MEARLLRKQQAVGSSPAGSFADGWNGLPYQPHKLMITGSTPVSAIVARDASPRVMNQMWPIQQSFSECGYSFQNQGHENAGAFHVKKGEFCSFLKNRLYPSGTEWTGRQKRIPPFIWVNGISRKRKS